MLKFILSARMGTFLLVLVIQFAIVLVVQARAEEMVIGEAHSEPGIQFIFEGAIKDYVSPTERHLPIDQTDVHLEARVNWAEKAIPEGTPAGGFVPYLLVDALIRNEKNDRTFHVSLVPHINLIDNFHYARNVALPGEISDRYTVIFNVRQAGSEHLSFHKDWIDNYGKGLIKPQTFEYKNLDFEAIAKASR